MLDDDPQCGYCGHLRSEHPKREGFLAANGVHVHGTWWPCNHMDPSSPDNCGCIDYAQPGSYMTLHAVDQ